MIPFRNVEPAFAVERNRMRGRKDTGAKGSRGQIVFDPLTCIWITPAG